MRIFVIVLGVFVVIGGIILFSSRPEVLKSYEVGEAIDSLNHVMVYYNGTTGNIDGRNVSSDGYNIGLKYQCVEFVKRYYFEYYNHKMPNSYGNAVDFFNTSLKDGEQNADRDLVQFSNPSKSKPEIGDLIVMDATSFNAFGHVAIISEIGNGEIQIIQQNAGVGAPTRVWIDYSNAVNRCHILNDRVLGWLRMRK